MSVPELRSSKPALKLYFIGKCFTNLVIKLTFKTDTKVKSEESTYHSHPRFEVEEEGGRTVPGSGRSFAGQPEV